MMLMLQRVGALGFLALLAAAIAIGGREVPPLLDLARAPLPADADEPPAFPALLAVEALGAAAHGWTLRAAWSEPATGPVPSYRYRGGTSSGPPWWIAGRIADRSLILDAVPAGGRYWLCVTPVDAYGRESTEARCNSFATTVAGRSPRT